MANKYESIKSRSGDTTKPKLSKFKGDPTTRPQKNQRRKTRGAARRLQRRERAVSILSGRSPDEQLKFLDQNRLEALKERAKIRRDLGHTD